ncbi:fibroblast growth factor 1-like [Actinia tenebrosa]|uniref:Fibroblast growth factor n=1 Tax=Actinia tenebrosa TaxID=6105 RepID=A0A6P8HBE8_ACTTE|nr:fibroblast growth factor 1-like [Actinia tenebrosa]
MILQKKTTNTMNIQTYISLILWLCTAVYLIVTSTYVQKTNQITAQDSKQKTTTTTTNLERTRRSVCSCAACNGGRRTMASRIPFGAARKVMNFLKLASQGIKFTYRRKGLMYCKNGYILKIMKDGVVGGTTQYTDGLSNIEFQSVGISLLVIKGVTSQRFLAINEQGDLYTTQIYNKDCVFEEKQEENFYHSFVSHRYKNKGWFVALRRNGQIKKTTVLQKATQFLILFSS